MKKIIFICCLFFIASFCNAQRVVYPFGQNGSVRFSDSTDGSKYIFTIKPDSTLRLLGKLDVNGSATATSFNKVAITAPATSATLTIANGKTLTVNNSIILTGTDGTTMTMPSTSSTLAGLGNTNTWTGATNTFIDIVGNYIKTDNTYVAMKVVQAYISSTGAFVNIIHGLGGSKWKNITNISAVVIHDSTGLGNYTVLGLGYNGNVANSVGSVLLADSLYIKYFVPANSTGLIGDTVKATIQYHK